MKPQEYKFIPVWCYILGSHAYYAHDEQVRASADNAPARAISSRGDGSWLTVDDIKHGGTRARFTAECLRRGISLGEIVGE